MKISAYVNHLYSNIPQTSMIMMNAPNSHGRKKQGFHREEGDQRMGDQKVSQTSGVDAPMSLLR